MFATNRKIDMQIVNVRFYVKPAFSDEFPAAIGDLVAATRAEPGNLWYLWSRSIDDPNEFVVLEGYTDDGFAAHGASEHFQRGAGVLHPMLSRTPDIIVRKVDGDGWDQLAALAVE